MTTLRVFLAQAANMLQSPGLIRCMMISNARCYSVFPSAYVKPIYKKSEQESVLSTAEGQHLHHVPIKPAFTNNRCSEFQDPLIEKFINYLMRKGRKPLARTLIEQTFEIVKRTQLQKYNSCTSSEKKKEIELDPKVIFYRAVENCTPVLELNPVTKGGIRYQVPSPLNESRALFLSMNWLLKAGADKDRSVRLPGVLAKELLDAADNKGRVVKKKQELHRQCEVNRAYAHFRWQ